MGLSILHVALDAAPKYLEIAGEAAEGVVYPNRLFDGHREDASGARILFERLGRPTAGQTDYVHPEGYDSVRAIVLALQAAGTPDRTNSATL